MSRYSKHTKSFNFNRFLLIGIGLAMMAGPALARVEFDRRFAPHGGMVSQYEQPQRKELCLNGYWQFQEVPIPNGYQWDKGIVPELSQPKADGWDDVQIKIPSPWNVNNWGIWGKPGTYDPNPLYYPSYPEHWKGVQMAWQRKEFSLPEGWESASRLKLHFDAVAGECTVLVNGKVAVESHYDTFTPFECDITELVSRDGVNELLVGVRSHGLFRKKHPVHKWGWDKMGPNGSDMNSICGIFQDVYLIGLGGIYTEDVFVKPWLDRNLLEFETTVVNTTDAVKTVSVGGVVREWTNLAEKGVLNSPEEKWELGNVRLMIRSEVVKLAPGESKVVTLSRAVRGELKTWSPESPNLYGAVITVYDGGKVLDHHYERFGWRQFTIENGDLMLNGERIQLYGDILHPFSAFIMSRRTAWAWYTMIKDFGGNAVRPHAQPWPKCYIDLADEMGIVVLDEAAVFGSAGGFNMDEEAAWEHCRQSYRALIKRDRNSPAVMGWSFANEMFALGALNKIGEGMYDAYQAKLAEYGRIALEMDDTREWISCDGDETLNGRLKVWSKHWGDGWKDKKGIHYHLPRDKSLVWMLGEYSGSYYGSPDRLDYFNGDRAYESYAGRVEALGIDVYELATDIARDELDYFSASETVWFGLEHLNYGYHDYSRLPNEEDGVFFTLPYEEGVPGMQPERLPPYVATLNPGWDPKLPLYKPLAMFEAMKAALAEGEPKPFLSRGPMIKRAGVPEPTIDTIRFVGDSDGSVGQLLKQLPVTLSERGDKFVLIDAASGLKGLTRPTMDALLKQGSSVMVMIEDNNVDLDALNRLLPARLELTDRAISNFVVGKDALAMGPFSLADLYLVQRGRKPHVMQCGLAGPLVEQGKVLLAASEIDWSLFDAPENRKCASLVLYEHLKKPSGAALVDYSAGAGTVYVCTIGAKQTTEKSNAFWIKLFGCLGVDTTGKVVEKADTASAEKEHDLLRDGPLN